MKPWRGKLAPLSANGHAGLLLSEGERKFPAYDEAIRALRNTVLLADSGRSLRSVLVSSAAPGEGKSTVAAHLAVAHAEQGNKTLLIDADLRRASLHRRFEIPGAAGLSNVLLAESPWRDALVKLSNLPELDVLPAGPPSRRASDLMGKGLAKILEEAAGGHDLAIVDGPPLLGPAEPLQMAAVAGGVLVVARAGQSNGKAVSAVLHLLRRLGANLLGVVLSDVKRGY